MATLRSQGLSIYPVCKVPNRPRHISNYEAYRLLNRGPSTRSPEQRARDLGMTKAEKDRGFVVVLGLLGLFGLLGTVVVGGLAGLLLGGPVPAALILGVAVAWNAWKISKENRP